MCKSADTAMYESKQKGRNRFSLFSPTMHAEILNTYEILQYLRDYERYLFFEFQPIFRLSTGKIAGIETLARMRGDDGRVIEPLEFVPLAVEHGLIADIGYFVLRSVCRFVAGLKAQGTDVGYLAVNISAAQLHDEKFIEKLSLILTETGIDPRRLMFEFTEDVVKLLPEWFPRIRLLPVP